VTSLFILFSNIHQNEVKSFMKLHLNFLHIKQFGSHYLRWKANTSSAKPLILNSSAKLQIRNIKISPCLSWPLILYAGVIGTNTVSPKFSDSLILFQLRGGGGRLCPPLAQLHLNFPSGYVPECTYVLINNCFPNYWIETTFLVYFCCCLYLRLCGTCTHLLALILNLINCTYIHKKNDTYVHSYILCRIQM
jgi:hypothetical protein